VEPAAFTHLGLSPVQEVEVHVFGGGVTQAMLHTPFCGQIVPEQQQDEPLEHTVPPHTGVQVMFQAQPGVLPGVAPELAVGIQSPTVHPALTGGGAPQLEELHFGGSATHAMLHTPFTGHTFPEQQHVVPLVHTVPPHVGVQVMFQAHPLAELSDGIQSPTTQPPLVGGRPPQLDELHFG